MMRPGDLNFVASGWKQSAADAPQNAALPRPKAFDRVGAAFEALFEASQRAPATVAFMVASDPERRDTLFGFMCLEQRGPALALHYAYTRKSHKRMGVCSELLRHALQGASDADTLVYTAGSRFDALWERWGFRRVQLEDWLRDAGGVVKDLTRPDIRLRERGKTVKRVTR
jgi:hypothetical protein